VRLAKANWVLVCSSQFQGRPEFRPRPAGRKLANYVTSVIYEDL
jgi:hypothetical protein